MRVHHFAKPVYEVKQQLSGSLMNGVNIIEGQSMLVKLEYLFELCDLYDDNWYTIANLDSPSENTKYCVQHMFGSGEKLNTSDLRRFHRLEPAMKTVEEEIVLPLEGKRKYFPNVHTTIHTISCELRVLEQISSKAKRRIAAKKPEQLDRIVTIKYKLNELQKIFEWLRVSCQKKVKTESYDITTLRKERNLGGTNQ
jgi:hypothetical protein